MNHTWKLNHKFDVCNLHCNLNHTWITSLMSAVYICNLNHSSITRLMSLSQWALSTTGQKALKPVVNCWARQTDVLPLAQFTPPQKKYYYNYYLFICCCMNIYQVPHLVIHPVSFTMLMVTAYLSTHTVYQYKINKNLIIGGGGGGGDMAIGQLIQENIIFMRFSCWFKLNKKTEKLLNEQTTHTIAKMHTDWPSAIG